MSTVVAEKSSSLGVADGDGSGLAASGDVAVSDSPAAGVTESSRLYYLDWIRVLSLLFVLLMHVVEGGGFVVRFLPDDARLGPDFFDAVTAEVARCAGKACIRH